MPPRKKEPPEESPPSTPRRRSPALSRDEYENRLINKALQVVERQMDTGEVSSQVLTHYLKASSSRERLEQERMQMEIELAEAKKDQLRSLARAEDLLEQAMKAFTEYSPTPPEEQDGY